jgi:two-component system, NarL family, sensor histidine kinase UhpB
LSVVALKAGTRVRMPERRRAAGWARLPLLWRVVLVNAALLALAVAMLVLTPATVSAPVAATELAVLTAGIAAMLAVDIVLLRRAFAPLRRLGELARDVDPLSPGQRLAVPRADPEVETLVRSFNEMLDRVEAERRDSARRALAAQEDERLRIARELHDELGQGLTAVVLQLERVVRTSAPGEREQLERTREAVRGTLTEMRDIARRLRPEALDDLGLAAALTALTTGFARQTGLHVERSLDAVGATLGPEEELVIYRVAQEALTNVGRHAHAEGVALALVAAEGRVVLTVRDDGIGIGGPARGDSQGIRGMRERAVLVGGALKVGPGAGGGAEVRLEVPVRGDG